MSVVCASADNGPRSRDPAPATGNRQQATGNRQQATGNGNVVKPLDELTAVERGAIARVKGIVWLIDSQTAMQSVNEYQFDVIRSELATLGIDLSRVPVVFQLNKRDLPDIVSAETLKKRFATPVCAYVESIATRSDGVIEALDTCLKGRESR